MGDSLRINGNLYSWGSWKFTLGGVTYTGVAAIKYSHSRVRTKGYGQGPHQGPRGRTRGKYEVENPSIKVFTDTALAIKKQLAALSSTGNSYGEASVPIVVQAFEPGLEPLTVELLDCTYEKSSTDLEEGGDPSMEEIEFNCMKLKENGLVLYDDSQPVP